MVALSRQNWPVDPSGKNAFYGNPGIGGPDPTWKAQNLVPYVVPWTGHSVLVHRLVRDSLDRVLTQYWNEIGHDQNVISKYGLADVETYNYRKNRNAVGLSNHSYGIAVDIAPSHQPNGTHWVDGGTMMPRRLIELFKFEGWRWGGDFGTTSSGAEHGTKDPMHFEAVHDEHHDQQPVPAPASVVPTAPTAMVPMPAATPSTLLPSTGAAPAPLVALAEAAATLVARQLISASPEAAQAAAELRAQAMIGREIADLVIALLDKVAPIPSAPVASPPIAPLLPSLTQGPVPTFIAPKAPAAPAGPVQKFTNIHATCFGGSLDRNTSAYDGHLINDTELGVSLPARLAKPVPKVVVEMNGKTVICNVVDEGPWNTRDDYWDKDARPLSESQFANKIRAQNGLVPTNQAGIDLTPGTVIALGGATKVGPQTKYWSGIVNWWFANQPSSGTTPMSNQDQNTGDGSNLPAGVTVGGSPLGSKVNITAAAAGICALVLYFTSGKLNLDANQVAAMLTLIGTVAPVAIMLFRTFATTTVFTHSLPKQPPSQ